MTASQLLARRVLPAADMSAIEVVTLTDQGRLPYCCPPCDMTFRGYSHYLVHMTSTRHLETCRAFYTAYTGLRLEGAQIVRGAPHAKATVEQSPLEMDQKVGWVVGWAHSPSPPFPRSHCIPR